MRNLKQIIKWSIYFCTYLKWRFHKKPDSEFNGIAHILLVKNISYVYFARICTLSFTLYNPKAQVVIHCDESTYLETKRKLSLIPKFFNVSILLDQNSNNTWQNLKTELVLSMNGSYDLYMDADLRWRNSVNRFNDLTFLVKEFQIAENQSMSKLLQLTIFKDYSDASMKNTSFLTFGGTKFSKDVISKTKSSQENFSKLIKDIDLDEKNQASLIRLSEQLCLSFFLGEAGQEVKYLKDSDARLDGGIVESPYFGATGLGF